VVFLAKRGRSHVCCPQRLIFVENKQEDLLLDIAVYFLIGIILFDFPVGQINWFSTLIMMILTTSSFSAFGVLSASFLLVFKEGDVRPTGRSSQGVIGMKLDKNDHISSMDVFTKSEKDNRLLVLSENGIGKSTKISLFPTQKRGGKGVKIARAKGLRNENIIIDPGIGFGKSLRHNLTILKEIPYFKRLGLPLLIGLSRKSFMGRLLGLEVDERLVPTVAADAVAVYNGADIIRVHDIKEAVIASRMVDAIKKGF